MNLYALAGGLIALCGAYLAHDASLGAAAVMGAFGALFVVVGVGEG